MRDEIGAKFQTVIFNLSSNAKIADYEGVIEVASKATDYPSNVAGIGQYALVYWVTGASAGCAVNKSNTNKKYDGELSIDVDKTQADLAADIEAGRFVMHNVNGDVRVLEDINSLTTTSDTKAIYRAFTKFLTMLKLLLKQMRAMQRLSKKLLKQQNIKG